MKDNKKKPVKLPGSTGFLSSFFSSSEELFKTIVKTSPDGICISDLNGKVVYANANNFSMIGVTSESEVLGTNIMEWIDPVDHEKAVNNVKLVFEGASDRDNHYLLLRKDGSRFYGAISAVPLADQHGTAFGMLSMIRDISNIKAIEKKLQETGYKYQSIIMHLTEGIVIVDENMRVIEWNPAMEAIMGARMEEIQGRPYDEVVLEFIPTAKRKQEFNHVFRKMAAMMLTTGILPETGMVGDIEIMCKDGARKFIRQTVFVIPVGDHFHIGSVTTDVTRRKEWEEELREREKRYRTLFETASDAILLMDSHVFLDCNLKALELFGCKREDLIGKSPNSFSPLMQPDGSPSTIKAEHYIRAALGSASQTFSWVHKRFDGTCFDAEVSLNEVDMGGRKMLQALVRDITARKRHEDRLRRFSECLLSFGSDAHQNINLLTRLCGEILGATSALYNRLQGEMLCSLGQWNTPDGYIPEDQAAGHICYDVITGKGMDVMIVRNLQDTVYFRTDPNVAAYHLKTYVGKAVFAEGQSVGSLCAVFQSDFIPDETDKYFLSLISSAIGVEEERKSAQDRLISRTEDLNELNRAKDKFFSIIAHDLKGPFNAILGFSDILTTDWDGFSEEERQHFVRNISNSAKNTFRLLENLLEWASTQTGKLTCHPVTFDLSTVANDVIILMRDQAEKKQIRLFTAINFGTMVEADENMVRTILRNLVSNAIKFTAAGGHVKVLASDQEWNGKTPAMVEITVTDTGIGISPEMLPKLFRIDEKTRGLGTAQEKGTGLGLILCKELVERNHGRIWAESEPDKGSRFHFTLPRA
jgi:PAS domain S-box-containing protein